VTEQEKMFLQIIIFTCLQSDYGENLFRHLSLGRLIVKNKKNCPVQIDNSVAKD